jgi:hypothetical protein
MFAAFLFSPARSNRSFQLLKRSSFGAAVALFSTMAGADAASPLPGGSETPSRLPEVVIEGTQGEGAYGQPGWANRSRTSPITNGYVLSPFSVYGGVTWEGFAPRHGKATNTFTPEVEVGLPHRFQIAAETDIEQFGDTAQNHTTSVELRYALADWNKIPLNPTIFAEWKFGTGRELQEGSNGEADKEEGDKGGEAKDSGGEKGKPQTPDSFEIRLLLSQEFGKDFQWSLNGFFEQEVGRDREQEIGFSQSLVFAPENSRLQPGVELQYINKTKRDTRGHAENSFVIGPSLGYQFTPRARIDLAPLFGIGHSSPTIDAFVVVSYLFGGQGEQEGHQPVSTRNR